MTGLLDTSSSSSIIIRRGPEGLLPLPGIFFVTPVVLPPSSIVSRNRPLHSGPGKTTPLSFFCFHLVSFRSHRILFSRLNLTFVPLKTQHDQELGRSTRILFKTIRRFRVPTSLALAFSSGPCWSRAQIARASTFPLLKPHLFFVVQLPFPESHHSFHDWRVEVNNHRPICPLPSKRYSDTTPSEQIHRR